MTFVFYTAQSQDHAPLEAVPPQITPADANVVAEVPASKDDVYRAQLQMSKAGKVQAAESLLEKAAVDPKVKKLINKKPTKGRGRPRAGGKGAKEGEVKSGDKKGNTNGSKVPERVEVADETTSKSSKDAPNEKETRNEALEGQWKEIDTWYVCICRFFISSLPCTKQKRQINNIYNYVFLCICITLCTTLSVWSFSKPVAEEPLIREAEIPIPDDVATKKSFTIKPPSDKPGTSTIGILFLDL